MKTIRIGDTVKFTLVVNEGMRVEKKEVDGNVLSLYENTAGVRFANPFTGEKEEKIFEIPELRKIV